MSSLISIIVPLYNHEHYIVQTLESFKHEGYARLEVVVLDDGSSDNSYAVAKAWFMENPNAFERVVLEQQKNQGITKTLNNLVQLATGDFITMVASDDLLLPNGLQVRLERLQQRPDWLGVFGDATMINQDGENFASSALVQLKNADKFALLNDDLRCVELMLRWCVPGPVLLLRREAFDVQKGIGLYNETVFLEDRDFYLRLLSKNALGFTDFKVAAYRWHPKNSFRKKENLMKTYEAIYQSELGQVKSFTGFNKATLEFLVRYAYWSIQLKRDHLGIQIMAVLCLLYLESEKFIRLELHKANIKRIQALQAQRS
jgi:alpha-1,3-rhamnosyltransferase